MNENIKERIINAIQEYNYNYSFNDNILECNEIPNELFVNQLIYICSGYINFTQNNTNIIFE